MATKKFEGLLFCTDLDGTVLNSKNSISKENLEAIEYFKENGGHFTFITGRVPATAEKIWRQIRPNAPFGCTNGAGVYDMQKGEYLFCLPLDRSVLELISFADEKMPDMAYIVSTVKSTYFFKENAALERYRAITERPNIICDFDKISEPIAKIIFTDTDPKKVDEFVSVMSPFSENEHFDLIRSTPRLYEILPKGAKKSLALEKICGHLNISMDKTIAIGDFNNDISMVKAAGLGIAVANACDDLKRVADHITVSCDESAIARVIYDLDSGKLRI